jgi:hypothetical protein
LLKGFSGESVYLIFDIAQLWRLQPIACLVTNMIYQLYVQEITGCIMCAEAQWLPLMLPKNPRFIAFLYRLNLAFARIVGACRELQGIGAFRAKFTRLHKAFAQELQAEINEEVLGILHGIETDDQYRFGKVRDARDKELRDPDDVFIHAKERRKELARQGKKQPKARKREG